MSGGDFNRLPVLDRRRAGVLLHLSSLAHNPGGALGAAAYRVVDWLADAGFSVWQLLPLGPTGADGSPYWARSDQAGNAAFLEPADINQSDLDEFTGRNAHWLEDYALFEAIGRAHSGTAWWQWPAPLRDRDARALNEARRKHARLLQDIRREQHLFDRQWSSLRRYAQQRDIRLFGDLPIYVAPDSVTTWANRAQFQLDGEGKPTSVAGVPPDYFSEDGQLWGNPLYDWERMRSEQFAFWRARFASQLQRFDIVRIDHFRALAAYWAVPFGAPNARGGQWRPAPGREMLQAVADEQHALPFIAEDLGLITPDVVALRKHFALPGMRVLQFGFDGDASNPHLLHNIERDSVVYTGTHDNDTTLGWYRSIGEHTRSRLQRYLGGASQDMPWALNRMALASVGQLAVLPLQDLLGLGSEARLNTPGTVGGNWSWRVQVNSLTRELAQSARDLNDIYGRF
ncbi:MAG: 4-alpha-glucanotransferase [Steroidobacteraceae bacterium]